MTDIELKQRVCRNIKRLRAECGYTIEKVSSECQISPRTVHNIEHEKSMPKLNTVIKLSRCLDVSVDKIINPKFKKEDDDE